MGTVTTQDQTKKFIESESKWVRVLAGPGTGKSYCLKEKLKYLVNTKKESPNEILVLTFTSVAVRDLKDDIKKLKLGDIKVSTLHVLALEILQNEGKNIRLMLNFEVDAMLRDLKPDIGYIRKERDRNKKKMLKMRASRLRGEKVNVEHSFETSLKEWLEQHQGYLLDELIPDACSCLEKDLSSPKKHQRFKWILVDEYQDLDPTEQRFVELLMADDGHLSVIGDDDQSIYEFKGASPDGFRSFKEKYQNEADKYAEIAFSKCYRCPACVVDFANKLINKNKKSHQSDKVLSALPGNQPGSFEVLLFQTPSQEIEELRNRILKERGIGSYGDIVVLSRDPKRGRKLYNALQASGIPSVLCFRGHLLESKVVKESYSLLSLVADQNNLVSWRYLLGEELSGEAAEGRAKAYQDIRDHAARENKGILEVLKDYDLNQINETNMKSLIHRYQEISSKVSNTEDEIKKNLVVYLDRLRSREPEYADLLQRAFNDKDNYDTNNNSYDIEKIRRAVRDELFSPEAAKADGRVRIMSLHAAKGLSAPLVIIMSAIEGLIPQPGKAKEEERRLFYVAITRCKGSKDKNPGKIIVSAYEKSDDLSKDYELTRFVSEMMKRNVGAVGAKKKK